MALKLDILANTRQFVAEMKKSGASVEDISDALDQMAKDGYDAGNKTEKTFRGMTKEVERTDKAIDKLGSGTHAGLKDFKQEGSQTAAEVAASFDGSAESIAGGFQELAANALSGFGPAGAAIGTALALGIGSGMAALEKFNEALETSREDAFDFASDLEGRANIGEQIQSWTTDMTKFSQAQDIAKVTGRDVASVIADLATGGEGLASLTEDYLGAVESSLDITRTRATELNGVLIGTKEGFEKGAVAADAQKLAVERLHTGTVNSSRKAREELEKLWKDPVQGTVKLNLDDAAVKQYMRYPPTITIPGHIALDNTRQKI